MKLVCLFFALFVFINSAFANPYIIRNDVDSAISQLKYSGRHEFEVTVKGEDVIIEGFVSSAEDKARVERAAMSVNGVTHVKNNLTVVGASAISTSNTAKIIRDRVKADSSINNYQLEVEHDGNTITLVGQVEEPADKSKILNIAIKAAPDANIENNLIVKNKKAVPDFEINEKVMSALKAEGVKGLGSVLVDTKEGVVTFKGEVKNHREIDQMLSIALMIDGVKSVRSDVKIGQ